MIKEFSNPYKLALSPAHMGTMIEPIIKARASNKGRTLTEDEPSAAHDQTAGKQRAGEAATNFKFI